MKEWLDKLGVVEDYKHEIHRTLWANSQKNNVKDVNVMLRFNLTEEAELKGVLNIKSLGTVVAGKKTSPGNENLIYIRLNTTPQDDNAILLPLYDAIIDRKSTRLNSSHEIPSRMPSSA